MCVFNVLSMCISVDIYVFLVLHGHENKTELYNNICESMCDLDWDSWKHFFGKTEVWQLPVVMSILLWLHWGWFLLSKSTPKGRLFGKLKPSRSICSALKISHLSVYVRSGKYLDYCPHFYFVDSENARQKGLVLMAKLCLCALAGWICPYPEIWCCTVCIVLLGAFACYCLKYLLLIPWIWSINEG